MVGKPFIKQPQILQLVRHFLGDSSHRKHDVVQGFFEMMLSRNRVYFHGLIEEV